MYRPEPRLKAEVWVKAHIRRCQALGLDAYLRHRGDKDAGSIVLKINAFDKGSYLLEPAMAMTGGRAWMKSTGPSYIQDNDVEIILERKLLRDADLWILEIEDPEDRHQLDEPIV